MILVTKNCDQARQSGMHVCMYICMYVYMYAVSQFIVLIGNPKKLIYTVVANAARVNSQLCKLRIDYLIEDG